MGWPHSEDIGLSPTDVLGLQLVAELFLGKKLGGLVVLAVFEPPDDVPVYLRFKLGWLVGPGDFGP
jgi:hypothetical protein